MRDPASGWPCGWWRWASRWSSSRRSSCSFPRARRGGVPRRPGAARRPALGDVRFLGVGLFGWWLARFAGARRAALPHGPRAARSAAAPAPRRRPATPDRAAPPRSALTLAARSPAALGVRAPPVRLPRPRRARSSSAPGCAARDRRLARRAARCSTPRSCARRWPTSSPTSPAATRRELGGDGGAGAHVLQPRVPGAGARAGARRRVARRRARRRGRAATGWRWRAGSSSSTARPPGGPRCRRTLRSRARSPSRSRAPARSTSRCAAGGCSTARPPRLPVRRARALALAAGVAHGAAVLRGMTAT